MSWDIKVDRKEAKPHWVHAQNDEIIRIGKQSAFVQSVFGTDLNLTKPI